MGSDSDIFTPDGEKNDYKVVGLIEDPSFYPPYAKGSAAVTLLDTAALSGSDTLRVWATMKTPKDSFKFAEEMKESLYPGGSYTDESVEIHNELLMYMGASDKDNINTILYTVVGILSVIIMAGSVSLIYNAFTISIGERSREYGMLSSVGSTPRQIRNSVFFEAFMISVIGIPLGIAAGIFGVGVTIQLIKPLMNDLFVGEMEFGLVVSPYGILIAAALAIITIFISAYIPSRRAGKMTAIEAIRQAKDIKLKAKKVKTSGITRKLFGFEGAPHNPPPAPPPPLSHHHYFALHQHHFVYDRHLFYGSIAKLGGYLLRRREF